MTAKDTSKGNLEAHAAWQHNASFWDTRMGEGNDFVDMLIWPATERFLEINRGMRVLDVACGNGLSARRLAAQGVDVTAIDFSEEMITLARKRSVQGESVRYEVLDATDGEALASLGGGAFDAVLCNMALFDMADISPLFKAVPVLLRAGGRFVFSILHPCFNNPFVVQNARLEERGDSFVTVYAIEVSRYMTGAVRAGIAMAGQPMPHPYFHRSLTAILESGFNSGLIMDAFEERAFPPEHKYDKNLLSWSGKFSEIPPILVCRMRPTSDRRRRRPHARNNGQEH